MNQLWAYAKTAFRLKLGTANPYKIAPKYCLLSQTVTSSQLSFMQKQKINRNTYLMRFALPEPEKCLGLRIGQFVKLHVGGMSRPYNPVSRIDEPGIVDFFVRDMRPENKQSSFTNRILDLKQGEKVEIEGPKTQYIYHGYGQMQWKDSPIKKYRHIGIIAYESGITGAYNLIDSIMPYYDSRTGISLLWVGEQLDDFVFIEEFSMLAEQQRLNFNLMLRELTPDWIGPYGLINQAHIRSYMPPPGPETALMIMGGPTEVDHLLPITKAIGYKHVMQPLLTA